MEGKNDFMIFAQGALSALAAATLVTSVAPASPEPLLPNVGTRDYDASDYALSYTFNPGSRWIEGTEKMTATLNSGISQLAMDFAGGKVSSVTVNDEKAPFELKDQKLLVRLPGRSHLGRVEVSVRFAADLNAKVPSPVDDTAGWGKNKDGGFAWWGQPDRSSLFFPNNSNVADKANFSYRIDVPRGWTAIANGKLTTQESSAGRTVFNYRTEHPLSAQLAQLSVGKFDIVTGKGPHDVPLRSAVPKGTGGDFATQIPKILSWLEEKIGRRYPLEVAGLLAVDGSSPQQTFALETQTIPVIPASSLTDKATIVHEFAHQWFGASAGIKDWNDIWLSEGFATYLGSLWSAENEDEPLKETMDNLYKLDKEARVAGITPGSPQKASYIFGVGRGMGGLAVYALNKKVGEVKFRAITSRYLDLYRDKSANSADFIKVAESIGGKETGDFLRNWLYSQTTPPLPS